MSLYEYLTTRNSIPLDALLEAMKSPDLAEMARARYVLAHAYDRLTSEPDLITCRNFVIDYYIKCIVENLIDDSMDDWSVLSRFSAARELRGLLEFWVDHDLVEWADILVRRITSIFLEGDESIRNAIETGFLEHVLERADLVYLFDHWKSDPVFSEAYHEALKWGRAHSRQKGK